MKQPLLFPDLDVAPGRHRTDDHHTSKEGARDIALRAGSQKMLLLDAYHSHPDGLTDEHASKAAGLPHRCCYWKRCGELRAFGLIVPTGDFRPGVAGVMRMVCRITTKGEQVRRGEVVAV